MKVEGKDYYKTLGIHENASEEDIRKAYRTLALHCHPDRNPGDPHAEEKFKAISEAYAVLIDREKRREYDLSRRMETREDSFSSRYSQEEIFQEFFRGREARTLFEELSQEFRRFGLRSDEQFFRHLFFGGRGFLFGGIFIFGGPFDWVRTGESHAPSGEWFPRIAQKAQGALTSVRKTLTTRGEGFRRALTFLAKGKNEDLDVTHDLPLTEEESRTGSQKKISLRKGDSIEELIVKVPAGLQQGTKLRLKGKGLIGKEGVRGDLYLQITITGDPAPPHR